MKRRTICTLAAALMFGAVLLCHAALVFHDIPQGRVEIAAQGGSAEQALRQAAALEGADWSLTREGGRFVIQSEHRFAAQIIQAALGNRGVPAQVLDYVWAPALLAQSGRLWRVWAALLGLWLLWTFFWAQAKAEWARARAALERQYPGEYLSDAGVRLLAKVIGLAVGAIATILLLQRLWRAEIALPPGFLPEGSVFDPAHYRRWAQTAFPDGQCSAYGGELAAKLKLGYALAAAECASMTVCAVSLRKKINRKGRDT